MSWWATGNNGRPRTVRTNKQQRCDYCGFKRSKDELECIQSSQFPPYEICGWMCANCRRERGGDM